MKKTTGIGSKILLLAVLLEIIAVVIILIANAAVKRGSVGVDYIYNNNLFGVLNAAEIKAEINDTGSTALQIILNQGNVQKINTYYKAIQDKKKNLDSFFKEYQKTIFSEEDKKMILELKEYCTYYYTLLDQLTENAKDSGYKGLYEYASNVITPIRVNSILPLVNEILEENINTARVEYDAEHSNALRSLILVYSLLGIGLVFSIVLSATITASITRPVKKIVGNLRDSTSQIAVSSGQLAESSQSIANGAQEQAAGIEETTASLDELSSMVKQNVANARQASILSEKAQTSSSQGFEKMTAMVKAMENISKSTEEIHAVIDVIDSIAFQTNMLALNAAVEAARAGEAGLGFAVVADEVKNLATRSSESAKETAAMIKETIKNVESGLSLSREMEELFSSMMQNSKQVFEMNREVESASAQQDEGIGQVGSAMMQFDTVVQANASQAEETASAAEEMNSQVLLINTIVRNLNTLIIGSRGTDTDHNNKKLSPVQNTLTGKPAPGINSASAVKKQVKEIDSVHKDSRKSGLIQSSGSKPENGSVKNAKPSKQADKEKHLISFEDDEDFKKSEQ